MSYMEKIDTGRAIVFETATDDSGLVRASYNGVKTAKVCPESGITLESATIFGVGDNEEAAQAALVENIEQAGAEGTLQVAQTSAHWTRGL